MAALMCLACCSESGMGWTDFDHVVKGDRVSLRCGRCGHVESSWSFEEDCRSSSPSAEVTYWSAYPDPGTGKKPAESSLIARGLKRELLDPVKGATIQGVAVMLTLYVERDPAFEAFLQEFNSMKGT